MDGPVCHVCLTPLTYHEGGVECAEAAPVVYVAIMEDKDPVRRWIPMMVCQSRGDARRYASLFHQDVVTFLGTRAVPLEPDSEGTP